MSIIECFLFFNEWTVIFNAICKPSSRSKFWLLIDYLYIWCNHRNNIYDDNVKESTICVFSINKLSKVNTGACNTMNILDSTEVTTSRKMHLLTTKYLLLEMFYYLVFNFICVFFSLLTMSVFVTSKTFIFN